MGKAGRWLRNLFLPGRKGRKAKDRADADCQSVLSVPLPSQAAAPAGREKRRWSFRRPGAAKVDAGPQGPLASSSSHCFSEAEVRVVVAQEQDQHQVAVPEAAPSAAGAAAALSLPASERSAAGGRDAAVVRIQSAFRSYLVSPWTGRRFLVLAVLRGGEEIGTARDAIFALRGMVKLQAMVRGQLVRRQADLTLRRMQALVDAQRRARAERLRLLVLEDDEAARQQAAAATTTPRPPPSWRSPQHQRSRKPLEAAEEGVRIVEVDDGARTAGGGGRHSSYSATPGRAPAKAEPCQKVSPTPSALTDASARTLSGRLDDASFTSASEAAPAPAPGRWRRAWRADPHPPPFFPSYMANTESSRAKARSQSAPRQRLSSASRVRDGLAVPVVLRPPAEPGRRRAAEGVAGPAGPARRVERCASRARATASAASSVPGSECGSSGTVAAPARTRHAMADRCLLVGRGE